METPTPETLNPDRTGKPTDTLRYMTLEEYASLPELEDGYTCELIRGVVVREPGPSWSHRLLQFKLGKRLDAWIEQAGQGEVGLEGDCILSENPDTVRIPDVAVLLRRRSTDNEPGGWVRVAPDIAVEVLSPSNTPRRCVKGWRITSVQERFASGSWIRRHRLWLFTGRMELQCFSRTEIVLRTRRYCRALCWMQRSCSKDRQARGRLVQ